MDELGGLPHFTADNAETLNDDASNDIGQRVRR